MRSEDGLYACAECGELFQIDEHGIANHVRAGHQQLPEGERIDHDADADHVPYREEP